MLPDRSQNEEACGSGLIRTKPIVLEEGNNLADLY
jgi:hypothetical protein